ncbi:hypothetical protein LZQ00_17135 [Sphingobacterium sp. SRCM116780]|uniref:hypothetical protein n=1 Tax=Sphingobacterium sp. SRCM116780 TaxID=2907623 RepID=UPI001F411939|nr:hypothetical protein [Sphingobacterium sp. SRCM116780]UIR55974.1 hypothetical protein LZQ00_17135 [Sphingobacterium sp. SRCM116780]
MKTRKKMNYNTPVIQEVSVKLEQGVAAGSVSFTGGIGPDPNNPGVDAWGAELPGGSTSGDL